MIKHKKFDMKYFFIEQALGNFWEIWGIYEFCPCPQIVPNIPQSLFYKELGTLVLLIKY